VRGTRLGGCDDSAGGGQTPADQVLIRTEDLCTHFEVRSGFADRLLGRSAGRVRAVDGVSIGIRRGEILGLVGESGSGKTTLGRTILKLAEPTSGRIWFEGRDITSYSDAQMRPLRLRMQPVFQDPHASLNPAMQIGRAIAHPLRIHGLEGGEDRVVSVMRRVGLSPPENFLTKYPSDLSGGQKQRVAIARAIITNPSLIVADEPVSMLDMSVRAMILELLLELREEYGLTYLFITHDLATAKFVCDRVAIMYLGKVVEMGAAAEIYAEPRHPYTGALLAAIPEPDPTRRLPREIPRGEIPDAIAPPAGCSFHPRCPKAFDACGWEARDLVDLIEDRWTRVPPEQFESEMAILGEVGKMRAKGNILEIPARGRDIASMKALLDRIRAEEGGALFDTVESVREQAKVLAVSFREGYSPRLCPVGGAQVSCHLFDEDRRPAATP